MEFFLVFEFVYQFYEIDGLDSIEDMEKKILEVNELFCGFFCGGDYSFYRVGFQFFKGQY